MTVLFFSSRTVKGCTRIPIAPFQVKDVFIGPRRIVVHCRDGCKHVNSNPTPKEVAFWTGFKVPVIPLQVPQPIRWDMATPDSLAMAALEEYELK